MTNNFTIKFLNLISDPLFINYRNIIDEPNIFKIVGRTHFERWHTCFWGWLLDSQGSHSLDEYILNKLLLSLLDESCIKPSSSINSDLSAILTSIEYSNLETRPNENDHHEVSISNVGRFDIFINGDVSYGNSIHKKINILIEMKIDTKTRGDQSKKYADWLHKNHPNAFNLLIYILPTAQLGSSPEATVGDPRWFCLDFQLLHDKLLLPVLDHPNLSAKVKPFIIQYAKNLKIPYRGLKMAITDEEKQIARELYEQYSIVFDSIYEALQTEGIGEFDIQDSPKVSNRGSGRISVRIGKKEFEGNSVTELFSSVLKNIVDSKVVEKMALPWGTGRARYIISNDSEPQHPNGRTFFTPVSYKGYTLEAHMDRNRSIKVLEDLCKKLNLSFELVEV